MDMDRCCHLVVSHCGLQYFWHENAFLSRKQAEYALERLWCLVAGDPDWEGEPVLSIPAIDKAVRIMLTMPTGKLSWIPLRDVLPPGLDIGLDTDCLPFLYQGQYHKVTRIKKRLLKAGMF